MHLNTRAVLRRIIRGLKGGFSNFLAERGICNQRHTGTEATTERSSSTLQWTAAPHSPASILPQRWPQRTPHSTPQRSLALSYPNLAADFHSQPQHFSLPTSPSIFTLQHNPSIFTFQHEPFSALGAVDHPGSRWHTWGTARSLKCVRILGLCFEHPGVRSSLPLWLPILWIPGFFLVHPKLGYFFEAFGGASRHGRGQIRGPRGALGRRREGGPGAHHPLPRAPRRGGGGAVCDRVCRCLRGRALHPAGPLRVSGAPSVYLSACLAVVPPPPLPLTHMVYPYE